MKKKIKIVIIVFILLTLILAGFFIYKIVHLNQSIHQPINNQKETEATHKKIKQHHPISIALFGVDTNAKRSKANSGQRTDTILIASVNPQKKRTKLITIPRDTYVRISGENYDDKITDAYEYNGPKTAVKTLENNFDIPIDAYTTIDMDGFKKMIDIFNGIKVKSNATFTFNDSHFKKNQETKLNGKEALDYVRSRKELGSGGDEGRTARQRQVIDALAKKGKQKNSWLKINKILKVSEENVKTNLTLGDMRTLYSEYKEATNSFDKLSLNGENFIGDDGIWYFKPNNNDQKNKIQSYKENLNNK